MYTKKYSKELKLAICEKYKNGISLSEIIKEYSLPTSMARTIKEVTSYSIAVVLDRLNLPL